MAGGIDWFRWHHGSVTDPKFQLVAKKSGTNLPAVLAVWAFALEKASSAETRGEIGDIDHEAVDCLFGLDDGSTQRILDAMQDRSLIGDGVVTNWDRRQPKRERDDDSAERVAKHRAKKRQEEQSNADVTPYNATQHQETPRGEERREEESQNLHSVASSVPSSPPATTAGLVCARLKQAGVPAVNPSNPKLLALLDAGLGEHELADIASEPSAKGKGFAWILATAEGRRRDAAQIGNLPQARGSPKRTDARTDDRRRTSAALTGRNFEQDTDHEHRIIDITPSATAIAASVG